MNKIESLPWMSRSPWVGAYPVGIRSLCWNRVNLRTGTKVRFPVRNANPAEMFTRILSRVEGRLHEETGY